MTNSIKIRCNWSGPFKPRKTSICSQKGSSLIHLRSTAQCNHLPQIVLSELRIVYFYYFTGAKGDLSLGDEKLRHHARSPMYSIALPVPIGMWNNAKIYKTCVNVELTKRKCQRTSAVTRILLPCHVSMGTTGTTGVSDGHASDTEFCYHTHKTFSFSIHAKSVQIKQSHSCIAAELHVRPLKVVPVSVPV